MACGSESSSDAAPIAVDDLPEGRFVVTVGTPNEFVVGRNPAAADGARWLAMFDSQDRPTRVYRRGAGGEWQTDPALETQAIVALQSSARREPSSTVPTPASMAGTYLLVGDQGVLARVAIDAAGVITPRDSGCRVSGRLLAGPSPMILSARLAPSDCGDLRGDATATLLVDGVDAPARFRLALEGLTPLRSWLAFAD